MLCILRAVSVQCNYDSAPPIDCHVAPNQRLLPPVLLLSVVNSDYAISIWYIVQMLTLSRLTDCQLYGSAGHQFSLVDGQSPDV